MTHVGYRLIFPFAGLVVIIITVVLLNTPIFFTYRSRANESAINIQDHTQQSSEAIAIRDNLPKCVSTVNYVPSVPQDTTTCLIQFSCKSNASVLYFSQPHFNCNESSHIITCSENAINTEASFQCMTIQKWIEGAAITCGCGEQQ